MFEVLLSTALWLIICIIYCVLYFWQAGKDRAAGTGFVDDE